MLVCLKKIPNNDVMSQSSIELIVLVNDPFWSTTKTINAIEPVTSQHYLGVFLDSEILTSSIYLYMFQQLLTGILRNSVKSVLRFLQQDQPFRASWKTGTPG